MLLQSMYCLVPFNVCSSTSAPAPKLHIILWHHHHSLASQYLSSASRLPSQRQLGSQPSRKRLLGLQPFNKRQQEETSGPSALLQEAARRGQPRRRRLCPNKRRNQEQLILIAFYPCSFYHILCLDYFQLYNWINISSSIPFSLYFPS